jgi:hypothetical protein
MTKSNNGDSTRTILTAFGEDGNARQTLKEHILGVGFAGWLFLVAALSFVGLYFGAAATEIIK